MTGVQTCALPISDPYELVSSLGEDELVQITERPLLSGDRRVGRSLAKAILTLPARGAPSRMEIARDLVKRLRRKAALIELMTLSREEMQLIIDHELGSSISALAEGQLQAAEDPGAYGTLSRDVRTLILDKVLSRNDIGATGSHQAAIVVAPRWAREIARLDEESFNPSVELEVASAALGGTWLWRLIHYNGRVAGGSTRDEYRLTNVGDFLRRTEPLPGQRLQLWRTDRGIEVELA